MKVIDRTGNLKQTTGAPIDANYLLFSSNSSILTNDRVLTLGDGLSASFAIPGSTYTIGGRGWNKISSSTASSSATIDFTGLSSSYVAYKIVFSHVAPATDSVDFNFQTSTDNGSSYDAGASDYCWSAGTINTVGTVAGAGDAADSEITLTSTNNVGNAANETISGELIIYNPTAAKYGHVTWQCSFTNAAGTPIFGCGKGTRLSAADVTAIRFLFSSGNITSGQFDLYGLAV